MNALLTTSLEQGLIFAVLAMGVSITYKLLKISDLSVEGSFPMGAFIFAKFITMGWNPILSTMMAFIFGTLAGLLTATLFTKLKIKPLLSGILTMNILYSVNLRINGKSNIHLFEYDLIFDKGNTILLLLGIIIAIKLILDLFLKTEIGYLLIATGDNESLVKSLGQSSDKYKILGLMLANGFIALSGALMAQSQGFVDITMGRSTIVVALASIIIGDTLFSSTNKIRMTTKAILGAVVYKIIGGIAISRGLEPTDLEAVNALIVIAFLAYNNFSGDITNFLNNKGGNSNVKNN